MGLGDGDENMPESSSNESARISDANDPSNTSISSELGVVYDPLLEKIINEFDHSSDFMHAINVFHMFKRQKLEHSTGEDWCDLSTSTPTIESSSSETILPQPLPQSPFRVLDTNTRKICGDVILR